MWSGIWCSSCVKCIEDGCGSSLDKNVVGGDNTAAVIILSEEEENTKESAKGKKRRTTHHIAPFGEKLNKFAFMFRYSDAAKVISVEQKFYLEGKGCSTGTTDKIGT